MNPEHNYNIPFLSSLARLAGVGKTLTDDTALLVHQYANSTDQELVRSFMDGNEQCFAVLLDRHLSMVYKFAYRYLNNSDDANDVAQDVFIKAWKYLAKFDPEKSFKTWLLTITKNTALDFIKRKKPVLFSKIEEGDGDLDAFLAPFLDSPDLPSEILEKKHLRTELSAMLNGIPSAYRAVLILRYDEHLKFREIAETLQEPIDTVKSKHRRGLIMLRKALDAANHDLRT